MPGSAYVRPSCTPADLLGQDMASGHTWLHAVGRSLQTVHVMILNVGDQGTRVVDSLCLPFLQPAVIHTPFPMVEVHSLLTEKSERIFLLLLFICFTILRNGPESLP